jgi:metal-sulfur cluster biosynthetic enzyme
MDTENIQNSKLNETNDTSGPGVTKEIVLEALKECYDPEIPVNIVDLGLVYEVKIDDFIPCEASVFVTMTLTAPGCPMGAMIASDVKRRLLDIPGVHNAHVSLVFDPIWTPERMSEEAKLTLGM